MNKKPGIFRPRCKVTGRFVPQRKMGDYTDKRIWNAFFSQGVGLNLAPRIPKESPSNLRSFNRVSNVARVWACENSDAWDINLGNDLCSDRFSKWLRTNKDPKYYRHNFEEYERALKLEFKTSSGITGNAIVFRGMPRLHPKGIRDKSPMSATKRLKIAHDYTSNRPGKRSRHHIVAILLRPGTKVLRIGGQDAEYLLPPGTVKPMGSPRTITRWETQHGKSNIWYIEKLVSHGRVYEKYRPEVRERTYAVVPAIFVPDPRWS